MLPRKVQYFLSIVENGSLTKAAKKLDLTQPTLSKFLSKLEGEVGHELFFRQKDNSLKLTEAGQVYLRAARKMETTWRTMEGELAELKRKNNLLIRLGIDGDSVHNFAQACADCVSAEYPNVSVEIHYFTSQEIQDGILNGILDMGLASYARTNELLEYQVCTRNEMDLVVCREHPLARYSYQIPGQEEVRISLRDLSSDTPFLLAHEGNNQRVLVDDYMNQMNFEPYVPNTFVRPGFLSDILNAKKTLVSFCPRNHIYPQLAYIALKPPFFNARGICYAKRKKLSPPENRLVQLLREAPKQRVWDEKQR